MQNLKLILAIIFIGFCTISANKYAKSKILKGKFEWQFTMTENEVMLIKQKSETAPISRKGEDYIQFTGTKFKEVRNPDCGNDITFHKTGSYYFSSKQLILNYIGGTYSDEVGGDSMQTYVKGAVFYNVKKISTDTIFLYRIKGTTTKKVARNK